METNTELLDRLAEQVRGKNLHLVFPEGGSGRMIRAARLLQDGRIARITLLGDQQAIFETARAMDLPLDGIEVLDPASDSRITEFARQYSLVRPKSSEAVILRLIRRPLFFAGMMVRTGDADAMLAGASTSTAKVVEAGLMTVGLRQGITTPSSFFLMQMRERPMIFADCALNVDPSSEILADIAIASARSYASLFDDPPRVALLSFSTRGSARHALVDKVRRAREMANEQAPGLLIEGEMQLDSALDPDVARRKVGEDSSVAGQANVLVFPDLNSGNIAYKLARYSGGATAIGPILQGFEKPVGDLSRGASVEEIIATAHVLLTQVGSDRVG